MDWRITPFEGAGPLKFGMSVAEVAAAIGPARRTRHEDPCITETRTRELPAVHYTHGIVTEIELFRDSANVWIGDVNLFCWPGLAALRQLELLNGGAMESLGAVLFTNLGLCTGRLDDPAPGVLSVCAFGRGLFDDRVAGFRPITFR